MTRQEILRRNILFPLVILLAGLILTFIIISPLNQPSPSEQSTDHAFLPSVFPSQTLVTPNQQVFEVTPLPSSTSTSGFNNQGNYLNSTSGSLVISLPEENHYHLYLMDPDTFQFYQLTSGNWDDIDPEISPDGLFLAFSSNRNGFWDIYILSFKTGAIQPITRSSNYDGSPSWSPDGLWLVFESYVEDNLDIFIQAVNDLSSPPIQLTNEKSTDFSPAWSPEGRHVAFVSDRSGDMEIWLANLNTQDNRFINLSKNPSSYDFQPSWSSDGQYLAWSSKEDGISVLNIQNMQSGDQQQFQVGSGEESTWTSDGTTLFTVINYPDQSMIGSYTLSSFSVKMPFQILPGLPEGFSWSNYACSDLLGMLGISNEVHTFTPAWEPVLTVYPLPPGGFYGIVPLDGVQAPYPYLHDGVDDAFQALRLEVAKAVGWNFLDTLENALIPITEPPAPELEENWLYTGRAFAINPTTLFAGWMIISREEYAGLTYWRIFLKTRYQDGSQGKPLTVFPWDLTARYTGNPTLYEAGGREIAIPPGYWVDFTNLALQFGWKRVPALDTWRTYYSAMLFNQYVIKDHLDWRSAMREIYPPEALNTPTRIPTSTQTLTPTITPTRTITERPTLSPTASSTNPVQTTQTPTP